MRAKDLILLVEDNENDVFLLRRAFGRAEISTPIQWVKNGAEAIAYLSGDGKFSDRREFPLPALVLLDLKMPILSGFEFLQWLRKHPELRCLRVVTFTASFDHSDVDEAYRLGTNSHSVKPLAFDDLVKMIELLCKHWFGVSETPRVPLLE